VASYAIGVDFGTASGRAILADVADGRQLATAVSEYSNGVIDEVLPLEDRRVILPPDWALQDPADYDVMKVLRGLRADARAGKSADAVLVDP
jgi:L-ribulokinase